MKTPDAAKLFECLSSAIRLEIFTLLIRYGSDGLVAGQIASALNLPATNLSFHLKALAHCHLVSVEQEGRFLRYRANLSLMKHLANFLTYQCCISQPNKNCTIDEENNTNFYDEMAIVGNKITPSGQKIEKS